MAYNLKYFGYHKDVDGVVKKISLSKEGFEGEPIEWKTTLAGLSYVYDSSDTLFDKLIVASQARLGFIFEEEYDLREFAYSRRTFKCEISLVSTGHIEWTGWVEPWDAAHEYMPAAYEVSLTAGCGLAHLSKMRYAGSTTDTTKSALVILQECLTTMGNPLPLRVSAHLKETTYAFDSMYGISSYTIDTNRYYDGDGKRMYCYQIVEDILQKFTAELFQYDNRWVMRGIIDHALGTHTSYIEYPITGAAVVVNSWPNIYQVNSSASLTLDGGQISILPPVNKYRLTVDVNPMKGFFYNGDLRLWTGSGLTGWDFSKMPAGNPGWSKIETGDEEYPYAFRVDGKGPEVAKEYRKHWYSPKRIKLFEPPEWIQSPTASFGPRNTVSLSFEYYTQDNSFLVGVMLTSSFNANKLKWIKTDGGASDEWVYIQVIRKKEVQTNGVPNAKGKFELTIPLEYLNAIPRKASDPYQPYNRVTVRFYKNYRTHDTGEASGNSYRIYNLRGSADSANGISDSGVYETEMTYLSDTDEEATSINLITGDYTPGFTGTTDSATTGSNTKFWARRGKNESISIYRAMMLDRISMTSRPARVLEADIKVREGEAKLSYLNILQIAELDNAKFKIVRFQHEDYRRIAKVTAIEILYQQPPLDEIKQTAQANKRPIRGENGTADGIYPTDEDEGGRINYEDVPMTQEELEDLEDDNARIPALFEDIPSLTYDVATLSTETVDLSSYFSEIYLDVDSEIETEFRHDPSTFVLSTGQAPEWLTSINYDGLVVYATGKPPKIGTFKLYVAVYDPADDITITAEVPIRVLPKTNIKYTLRDTSGVDPVAAGIITNGSGHPLPASWDILVEVNGYHEGWFGRVSGMGIEAQQTEDPYAIINGASSATYIIGQDIISESGLYELNVATFRIERLPDFMNLVKRDVFRFTLYDEIYEAKARFFLWGAESNTLIGAINPNGLSAFIVSEPWDVKMVVSDVEHDSGVSILGSEVGALDTANFTQSTPVDSATYFQLGEVRPEFDPSTYNVNLSLALDEETQYNRSVSFTINKRKVQPTSNGLKIGTRPVNTTNFDLIADLEPTGNSFELPANWVLLCDATSDEFDYEAFNLLEFKDGALVEQNVSAFTGKKQYRQYAEPVTQSDFYMFEELTSLRIGNIHKSPSTFRLVVTRSLGGVSGEVVAIYKSDFSFGPAVDITDAPIATPGAGLSDYVAGDAMGENIENFVKAFNVLVDGTTVKIDEDENWLTVGKKSLGFDHFKNIPGRIILGNIGATDGFLSGIDLIDAIEEATSDNILTASSVKNYIDIVVNSSINGTTNFIPKFGADHNLLDSIIREVSGNIGIGIDPLQDLHVSGNILATGQLMSSVATGAPISVVSASLVPNLNADLLDGQHGSYYLDYTNLVNKPLDTNQYVYRGTYQAMDANTLTSGGWYDNGAGTPTGTNLPLVKQGFIQVTPYRAGAFAAGVQDFISAGTVDANYGRRFFRVQWNGTYSAWKEYGTVTSVGLTVPTGFTVSNSPVTTSGNIALSFTSGYSLPTIAKQTQWDAAINRWVRPLVDYSDVNNFTFGGVGTWANTALNRPASFGSSLTFVGGDSTTGDSMAGAFINTILAATTGDWYVRYNLGTIYQIWTSKQFSVTNIANWNTAYSWGDPAGVYVPLSRLVSTGTGLTGGGSLSANRTLSFDTTWGDARYLGGTVNSIDWNTTHTDGRPKFNTNATNGPLGATLVHGAFFAHAGSTAYGTSLSFRNNRGFFKSMEAGSWSGSWQEIATQAWVSGAYASNTISISTTNSIQGGGNLTSSRTLSLVGDSGAPGNNMLYGTNGSGVKGWYAQPSGSGGTITGSGTNNFFTKWTGTSSIGVTVVQDTGTEINIANTRSFGVEGAAAMRGYLHVWNYLAIGTASNHGSMVIHNQASATADPCAALEIISTTKGILAPRMTVTQMLAIASPKVGLIVHATNGSLDGLYCYSKGAVSGAANWKRILLSDEL